MEKTLDLKMSGVQELGKEELKDVDGGITIHEYREVVAWLSENNPAQLEVVLAMFDTGQIQFEV